MSGAGSSGPGLGPRLHAALEHLVATTRRRQAVLVALDFDGVLAPLVDDPAASRAIPSAVEALERLATIECLRLALVSGRGLADLASCAQVPDGTVLVGSHGAETGTWRGSLIRSPLELAADRAATHAELVAALQAAADGSSARVEVKPTTVVLHTRLADAADTSRLTEVAHELGVRLGADVMDGRDVVEVSVLTVTKGDALTRLRSELGVEAVMYAGDDATDERAFAALASEDVRIRVGPGQTLAEHRVADPAAMSEVLHTLADLIGAPRRVA